MKIAIIAFWTRGGAMGPLIQGLAQSLTTHGEVHLFVPQGFDLMSNLIVTHYFKSGATSLAKAFNQLDPKFAINLWHELAKIKPDIIHVYNGEGHPAIVYVVQQAKKSKIPTVLSVHDPEPHPGINIELLYSLSRKFSLAQANVVHVFSRCFVDLLNKAGNTQERIRYVPLGNIGFHYLPYRATNLIRERVALFFGRLEKYKGLETLVQTGLAIGDDIQITIAGPGKLNSNLQKVIAQHPKKFTLINKYISDNDVAHLLQRASVCVMPYHQATQSCLPEIAASFGLPVVASDVGGLAEYVTRINGRLVPPRNPELLATAIQESIGKTPRYPSETEYATLATAYIAMYKAAQENT